MRPTPSSKGSTTQQTNSGCFLAMEPKIGKKGAPTVIAGFIIKFFANIAVATGFGLRSTFTKQTCLVDSTAFIFSPYDHSTDKQPLAQFNTTTALLVSFSLALFTLMPTHTPNTSKEWLKLCLYTHADQFGNVDLIDGLTFSFVRQIPPLHPMLIDCLIFYCYSLNNRLTRTKSILWNSLATGRDRKSKTLSSFRFFRPTQKSTERGGLGAFSILPLQHVMIGYQNSYLLIMLSSVETVDGWSDRWKRENEIIVFIF